MWFHRNVADCKGGGGLFADETHLTVSNLSLTANTAHAGGGAGLLWYWDQPPEMDAGSLFNGTVEAVWQCDAALDAMLSVRRPCGMLAHSNPDGAADAACVPCPIWMGVSEDQLAHAPFLRSGIAVLDRGGRSLRYDEVHGVLRLGRGLELTFDVLAPARSGGSHMYAGTVFVALQCSADQMGQELFLKRVGSVGLEFVPWSEYVASTAPHGNEEQQFAWQFIHVRDALFRVFSMAGAERLFLWHDPRSDTVQLEEVNESLAMLFRVEKKVSDEACDALPSASNCACAPGAASCSCNAGFAGPSGGPCEACSAGAFKSTAGEGVCLPCPAGTFTSTKGQAKCLPCPPSTYGLAGAATSCLACPNNTRSLPGSVGVSSCECSPGFLGPDGGPCRDGLRYDELVSMQKCDAKPEFEFLIPAYVAGVGKPPAPNPAKRFFLSEGAGTPRDHHQFCVQNGGRLAVIRSLADQEAAAAALGVLKENAPVHIGLFKCPAAPPVLQERCANQTDSSEWIWAPGFVQQHGRAHGPGQRLGGHGRWAEHPAVPAARRLEPGLERLQRAVRSGRAVPVPSCFQP